MNDQETERLLEILKEMNRNIEKGLDRINESLRKISEDLRELN